VFCPKCGANNLDDAKFCRSCGADIHLVPQALTGHLPEGALEVREGEGKAERKKRKKAKEPPTLEQGLENFFLGIAFLVIFLLGLTYFNALYMLWIWFIIPALAGVGEGIGQVIRSLRESPALPPAAAAADFRPEAIAPPAARRSELPAADTSEILTPPVSVTESTTRNLAERSPKDT